MIRTLSHLRFLNLRTDNLVRRIVAALVEADRKYRDRCHVCNLTDEQLRDIGLSREDAQHWSPPVQMLR